MPYAQPNDVPYETFKFEVIYPDLSVLFLQMELGDIAVATTPQLIRQRAQELVDALGSMPGVEQVRGYASWPRQQEITPTPPE